jgi:hypothetical protein
MSLIIFITKVYFITDLIVFSGHHNIIFFNTLVLYFRYLFFVVNQAIGNFVFA